MGASVNAISYILAGTAASSFHVPDTIVWSSKSAQTKNQVIVVQLPVRVPDQVKPADSSLASDRAPSGVETRKVDALDR